MQARSAIIKGTWKPSPDAEEEGRGRARMLHLWKSAQIMLSFATHRWLCIPALKIFNSDVAPEMMTAIIIAPFLSQTAMLEWGLNG